MKKRGIRAIVCGVAILAIAGLAACNKKGAAGKLTLETLPVIDGATATRPYYEGVVERMLGVSAQTARESVLCSTTAGAYTNLINGDADMVFGAMPSADQEKEAAEKGVEFEYHQILSGGFVFFVNVENPINSLSVEQLKGIYRGEITNWKEVGGMDEPIVAFQREEGSGSQTGLYRYVLPKEEVMKAPEQYYFSDMNDIIDAFGNAEYDNSTNAIGYSYYYYVVNMKSNDKLKMIAIDGINPDNDTIGSGIYPFCNTVVAVMRKGTSPDSAVYTILDWILSEEGAKLAEDLGYVAVRPNADKDK